VSVVSRRHLAGAVANLVVSHGAFRRLIPLTLWPLVLDYFGRMSSASLFGRSAGFGSNIVKRCSGLGGKRVEDLYQGIDGSLRGRGLR